MGDRAVDCARLESVCAERHRGFESPPIRIRLAPNLAENGIANRAPSTRTTWFGRQNDLGIRYGSGQGVSILSREGCHPSEATGRTGRSPNPPGLFWHWILHNGNGYLITTSMCLGTDL
jgi:hypothetical protein